VLSPLPPLRKSPLPSNLPLRPWGSAARRSARAGRGGKPSLRSLHFQRHHHRCAGGIVHSEIGWGQRRRSDRRATAIQAIKDCPGQAGNRDRLAVYLQGDWSARSCIRKRLPARAGGLLTPIGVIEDGHLRCFEHHLLAAKSASKLQRSRASAGRGIEPLDPVASRRQHQLIVGRLAIAAAPGVVVASKSE